MCADGALNLCHLGWYTISYGDLPLRDHLFLPASLSSRYRHEYAPTATTTPSEAAGSLLFVGGGLCPLDRWWWPPRRFLFSFWNRSMTLDDSLRRGDESSVSVARTAKFRDATDTRCKGLARRRKATPTPIVRLALSATLRARWISVRQIGASRVACGLCLSDFSSLPFIFYHRNATRDRDTRHQRPVIAVRFYVTKCRRQTLSIECQAQTDPCSNARTRIFALRSRWRRSTRRDADSMLSSIRQTRKRPLSDYSR